MTFSSSQTGGRRLRGLIDRLENEFSTASKVKLGFPDASISYPPKSEGGASIDVVIVAAINEFGSGDGKIPERSFLRLTLIKDKELFLSAYEELGRKVIRGEITGDQALRQLGELAQQRIQKTIQEYSDPGNAESTIAEKGEDNPLSDTGLMAQSVRYVIED